MHESCYLSALFKSTSPLEQHFREIWTNLSHCLVITVPSPPRSVSQQDAELMRIGMFIKCGDGAMLEWIN